MVAYGVNKLMRLQASTPAAGFALQNATPTILSWTAPNDGQVHRFQISAIQSVSSNETGGAVNVGWTDPSGAAVSGVSMFAASNAAGEYGYELDRLIEAGATVSIVQTALTGGAAVVYIDLMGR